MTVSKSSIDTARLPQHVAIIMDGNGRWAKEKGQPRVYGHKHGVATVHKITEAAANLGIKHLSLYTFSTENWNRPESEVSALMSLLSSTIRKEIQTLIKNDIRLEAVGCLEQLPNSTYNELMQAIEVTKDNKRMTLTLALSYSGRWDMLNATKKIAQEVADGTLKPEDITAATIDNHLSTSAMPDPELLIRTSGEYRISNYMLWQLAYTELYFSPKYWPAFDENDFYEAIIDFQSRTRRFGKTNEQITK